MAILTVGRSKQYASLHAALDAARDGDVVNVSSGLYIDDLATIRSKVTLNAVGGKVTLLALAPLAPGQGVLTVTTDATITGFVFAGAKAADGTAAGLLDTGGALTLRNTLFTGDQTGLVVRGSATGTVVIQGSEFAANGIGDGFSGNINVGAIAALTITDSYVHDAAGDEISSLAKSTVITGTRILDSTVPGLAPVLPTADVNLPNGGVVLIQNSILEKAANGAGPAIRVGGGTPYAATSITITGDTIVSDKPGATVLQNTTTIVASITNDQIYGFGAIATGPAVQLANTVPASRPVIALTPLVVPGIALPVDYGRAGAVVANGTVLTVGVGGSYRTLALALAAAHDGDTIRVAAGTYTETGVVISHKVIIEGVGGIARFVAGGTPANGPANGVAEFTTTPDVTLRNIELTGAGVMGGVAAGIHDQGGNLTVVNSFIHDNQAGLVADAGLAGSIGIYDTELARNGTVDGVGANLDVGEVGTLTLRNVWVHAAVGGAELRSRADTTTIDASRILQSSGSGTNAIDLPQAGRVSIINSVIEKASGSLGGALVHVGGGAILPGSGVVLTNDTLISDVAAVATQFVVAEAAASGMVALAGVAFEGGAPGSVQAVNATGTGSLVRTGLSVATAAPWASGGAPPPAALTVAAPVAPTAEHGVLILRVSGDAYRGDACFTLSIDGQQIGDTLTAGAVHGGQQSQSFTIAGQFAPGAHVIGISLVNDLSGAAGQDRNLYVDGVGFNGVDLHKTATLTANGSTMLVTAPVSRSTPVTVNLSEDAWKGDAQAFISIDGQVQGSVVTATASHAAGATQAMSFLVDLAPGAHTVAVTYLNDAASDGASDGASSGAGQNRNLYIDSVDIAGAHYPAARAALTANGTSTFAFTQDPPPAANTGLFLTVGLAQPASMLMPLG